MITIFDKFGNQSTSQRAIKSAYLRVIMIIIVACGAGTTKCRCAGVFMSIVLDVSLVTDGVIMQLISIQTKVSIHCLPYS